MNDDAVFLIHRVDCIAGKPPPTTQCLLQDSAVSETQGHPPQLFSNQKFMHQAITRNSKLALND